MNARVLKIILAPLKTIESDLNDNAEMIALGEAEGDDDIVLEAEKTLKVIKIDVEKRQLESMLSGEADTNDAFLEVNSGAGGTEAQDWAEMIRSPDKCLSANPSLRFQYRYRHSRQEKHRPKQNWYDGEHWESYGDIRTKR